MKRPLEALPPMTPAPVFLSDDEEEDVDDTTLLRAAKRRKATDPSTLKKKEVQSYVAFIKCMTSSLDSSFFYAQSTGKPNRKRIVIVILWILMYKYNEEITYELITSMIKESRFNDKVAEVIKTVIRLNGPMKTWTDSRQNYPVFKFEKRMGVYRFNSKVEKSLLTPYNKMYSVLQDEYGDNRIVTSLLEVLHFTIK